MEVLAGHPAFARFHDLSFLRQTGLGGDVVGSASVPWFRRMKLEGVDRLKIAIGTFRLDGNHTGNWGIVSEGDKGLEVWTPTIGRRFEGHHDLQPLRLTMSSGRIDRWTLKPLISVDEASEALETALTNAQSHLDGAGQHVAANAVGKFLSLHQAGSPEVDEISAVIVADLNPCAAPLFASAMRTMTLLTTTGWLTSPDHDARKSGEMLWDAVRTAVETAI